MSTSEQFEDAVTQPFSAEAGDGVARADSVTRQQALRQAGALYRGGDWGRAEQLCRWVLDTSRAAFAAPDAALATEVHALGLLGAITAQTGRSSEAAVLLGRVVAVRTDDAGAHNNYGNVLHDLGRFDAALASFSQAILLQPDYAEAYNNRGNTLQQLGRLQEALDSYERALVLKPDYAEAHNNRGNVLRELGHLEEALASLTRALALKPDYARAHSNRGNVQHDLGRPLEALESYAHALRLKPDFPEAYNNRGNALRTLGRLEQAQADYRQALALKPDFAAAWSNQGGVLHELGRLENALDCHEQALAIRPQSAEALTHRGNVLRDLQRFADALHSYGRALELRPDYAEAYNSRASTLRDLDDFGRALQDYDRAIALRPDYADAHNNRGATLQGLQRVDEALACFERALQIKPGQSAVHVNRAMAHLLLGQFERGWSDYEWRWRNKWGQPLLTGRPSSCPQWYGEQSLAGRTILLHAEQGLGDTVQFCRYVERVAALGARVILEVPGPLASLVATLEGVGQVIVQGEVPEAGLAIDYHCPLLSLPQAFRTTLDSIPASVPYLRADAQRARYWQQRLGERSRPRVGLVWSGGFRPGQPELWSVNRRRNIALASLAPLRHRDIEFYSLQKGQPAESEWAQLRAQGWDGPVLIDFTSELRDFADTAALIEQLDLVISVDTSVAHLAGALGKPVWILNRFDTCWRWLLDRTDSPWYPTVKLYRQQRPGDWDAVVRRVRADLERLAHGASACLSGAALAPGGAGT
jgi:tetratricopeptide (TPR) repeat protein